MLPLTRGQLSWTARYLLTVPVAAAILVALRWGSASGAAARFALVADSVWHAAVWPLYLILLAAGAAP